MRKVIVILLLFFVSCNSEDANDCFQTSGTIIQEDVAVDSFQSILVNRDIELIIKEAPNYKVTIETGENLINDVSATVVDNNLILTDNNTCNYVRDYGITKVYVEAPMLSTIRTSTQYDISSDGTLNYTNLTLQSEGFSGNSEFTVGDFRLSVNVQNLEIISNGLSIFYIDGEAEDTSVQFFAGAGRFEGAQLTVQHADVLHRGSNDMIVNAIQSLTGELRGTGDLISVNQPLNIDVQQLYTGQLIFN